MKKTQIKNQKNLKTPVLTLLVFIMIIGSSFGGNNLFTPSGNSESDDFSRVYDENPQASAAMPITYPKFSEWIDYGTSSPRAAVTAEVIGHTNVLTLHDDGANYAYIVNSFGGAQLQGSVKFDFLRASKSEWFVIAFKYESGNGINIRIFDNYIQYYDYGVWAWSSPIPFAFEDNKWENIEIKWDNDPNQIEIYMNGAHMVTYSKYYFSILSLHIITGGNLARNYHFDNFEYSWNSWIQNFKDHPGISDWGMGEELVGYTDWSSTNGASATIVKNKNNHAYPLRMYETISGYHAQVWKYFDGPRENGAIEFYLLGMDVNREFRMYFKNQDGNSPFWLSIMSQTLTLHIGSEVIPVSAFPLQNNWYHLRLEWGASHLLIYLDGILQGYYQVNHESLMRLEMFTITQWAEYYVDALGCSWDGYQPATFMDFDADDDGVDDYIEVVSGFDPTATQDWTDGLSLTTDEFKLSVILHFQDWVLPDQKHLPGAYSVGSDGRAQIHRKLYAKLVQNINTMDNFYIKYLEREDPIRILIYDDWSTAHAYSCQTFITSRIDTYGYAPDFVIDPFDSEDRTIYLKNVAAGGGYDIISMSRVTNVWNETTAYDTITELVDVFGVTLVTGVGNDNMDKIRYYANHDKSIAVGGSISTASPTIYARFDSLPEWGSNYGKITNGRGIEVGVDVVDNALDWVYYATSWATARCAGTVALMLQQNPNLTPWAVRSILRDQATHSFSYNFDDVGIPEAVGWPSGWNLEVGYGQVATQSSIDWCANLFNAYSL